MCQGPCVIDQGPREAASPKGSLVAAKGPSVAVPPVKGPVRQQAPSPLSLEHGADEFVLGSLHTLHA